MWRDPKTDYHRRQIFSRPDHPVEPVQTKMPAGQAVTLPAASYARIRQVVLVLTGKLTIVETGKQHDLNAGVCLGFGLPGVVTFANETGMPCVYLVALERS